MTLSPTPLVPATYHNPVYRHDFADPFVFKHCGEYWAYGTGFWEDGWAFGILRSRDLIQWEAVGGAMEPLPGGHTCYWAPEVTYDNGRFHLYYSVGNEEQMQIRVAVAEHPAGPFVDSGHRLTSEPFAIDAHVFQDDDGTRYLFYATDYPQHIRVGTGTTRDRMLDPFTLAGEPHPVTRAQHDWQIYDPQRKEKGGVRWHTIEGSFVLKHKGLYYQMFSGGNWQNVSYGVSYAVTETLGRSEEWTQVADGKGVLPILRTIPGEVVGPGHNSVVRGPDNQQLYCIYHRWAEDGSGRQLALDPLDWAGERMLVLGPSTTAQPAPLAPTFADYFDVEHADDLGPHWVCQGGHWTAREGAAHQERAPGSAEARCATDVASFWMEVSLRAEPRRTPTGSLELPSARGGYGVNLYAGAEVMLRARLVPARNALVVSVWGEGGWKDEAVPLPAAFEPAAWHLLRLEVDGGRVRVCLDEVAVQWEGTLAREATSVALCTQEMAAAFAGFALTAGWQHDWMEPKPNVSALGWEGGGDAWTLKERVLRYVGAGESTLVKGPPLSAYELVVNARLTEAAGQGAYGVCPALRDDGSGPRIVVQAENGVSTLLWRDGTHERVFALPESFSVNKFQQLRFRKAEGQLTVHWEEHFIAEGDAAQEATRVGLYARGPGGEWDMVRVTGMGTVKDEG